MCTKSLLLSGAIASLAWASLAPAAVIMEDNFDTYANQAAFEAVWGVVGALPSGVLSTTQADTPPNSIHNLGTTVNAETNRNQRLFDETGFPDIASDTVIRYSLDFYDSNAAVSPFRHHSNLQDGTGATASGQLVALGMNNNQLAAWNGGNYYMGRILGYNPDEQGATGSGAFFKLNGPGAPLRSTGWHNLAVEISDADFRFYVDGILSEIVPNTFALRSYDVVRLGSGLSNANNEAYWDNVKVETIRQIRPSTWNLDADENWSGVFSWTGEIPNAAGAEAVLGEIITAPRTITISSPVSVGRLTLQNANTYTIAGTGPLTLDASIGPGVIHSISGSHVISAPLALADNTAIAVEGAQESLSLTGALSASGVTVTKSGGGTLNINGAQTIGPGTTLTLSAGITNINTNAGSSTARNLTVNANSTTNFIASQHLAGLTVGADVKATVATGAPKNIVTSTLSIAGGAAPTGAIDITDNAVIVDYPAAGPNPADAIRGYLVSGRGNTELLGTWDGLGINSSTAAVDPSTFSVGYANNADLPLGSYTNFRGEAVDDTTVLIRTTRVGDANLDGIVGDEDVTIVGATYGMTEGATWAMGDFTYDGAVDDADVTLISALYNPTADPLPSPAAGAVAAVPEPTSVALLALAGMIVLIASRATKRRCSRF